MMGILTDVTKCVGCNKCVDACAKANGLKEFVPSSRHNGDGLGSNRWTTIIKARKGDEPRFVRKQCRHCLEPACASACIVGALQKTENGPVIYDQSKCMGCRYCMMACPYAIPRYSWEDVIPYVRKCILCYERLESGRQPACTEACPEGATIFGERDRLIAEARQRIEQNPGRYIPEVFGEKEVGGTSVLYLSDIPLDFLAWSKNLGQIAQPKLTWDVLKAVPLEFLGMGALMGGIYFITGRRQKVAEAEAAEKEQANTEQEQAEKEERQDEQA